MRIACQPVGPIAQPVSFICPIHARFSSLARLQYRRGKVEIVSQRECERQSFAVSTHLSYLSLSSYFQNFPFSYLHRAVRRRGKGDRDVYSQLFESYVIVVVKLLSSSLVTRFGFLGGLPPHANDKSGGYRSTFLLASFHRKRSPCHHDRA